MPAPIFFSHPLFAGLALLAGLALVLESIWLLWRYRLSVRWTEQAVNLATFLVGEAIRFAMRGLFLATFFALSSFAPLHVGFSPLAALLCFLGVDLLLYGWHRFLHLHPLGFALHSVHHTGRTFSLTLGGRLPWPLRLVDDLVCLPMALLGFDPLLIYLCMASSFAVQFLAHAHGVGRLGPLDWLFNTPSNHRVHHHARGAGQQRNFGAALMLWD